jgi:hypothetical protein
MAIYRILKLAAFEPDAITRMVTAYEDALRVLGVADLQDPITEIVAKKIIELAPQGESDPMRLRQRALEELGIGKIPHAHTVTKVKDPPCVTLYVATALIQNPRTPGFNAEAKQEMLRAIAKMVNRDNLDGFVVAWSVPPPAPITLESKAPSAA